MNLTQIRLQWDIQKLHSLVQIEGDRSLLQVTSQLDRFRLLNLVVLVPNVVYHLGVPYMGSELFATSGQGASTSSGSYSVEKPTKYPRVNRLAIDDRAPKGLFDTSCLEVVCGTGVLTSEVPQSCDGVLYLESFETSKAVKTVMKKVQTLSPFLTCLSLPELSVATRKRSEHKSNLTVAANVFKIAEQIAKQDKYVCIAQVTFTTCDRCDLFELKPAKQLIRERRFTQICVDLREYEPESGR